MQLSFAFFVCKQYINIRAFVQHNIIYYRAFFLYTSSIGPFSICNCLLHSDREEINKKLQSFSWHLICYGYLCIWRAGIQGAKKNVIKTFPVFSYFKRLRRAIFSQPK